MGRCSDGSWGESFTGVSRWCPGQPGRAHGFVGSHMYALERLAPQLFGPAGFAQLNPHLTWHSYTDYDGSKI